jgi:hypothetical protein
MCKKFSIFDTYPKYSSPPLGSFRNTSNLQEEVGIHSENLLHEPRFTLMHHTHAEKS